MLFRVEVTFLSLKTIQTVKFAENLWVSFSISCTYFEDSHGHGSLHRFGLKI